MKSIILALIISFSATTGFSQPNSPAEVNPLHVGDSIPNVSIKDLNENSVSLRQLLKDKPTIIIFYRGGWCPFCNTHLSNLQDITNKLKKKGVQLLAISGDGVGEIQKTKEKNGLSYQLFSDPNLMAASAFGIAFLQNGNWKLPVPSVFIIDPNSVIRFVHYDPQYQVRLDNETIMEKINEIIKSNK